MNKIKLNKDFILEEKDLQPFPRKNFAAICFFDFFWKGKKIMSFPMQSTIFPWGMRLLEKEDLEEDIISKNKFKYMDNLFIKNNYILSLNFKLFDVLFKSKDTIFWFWFHQFFKEEFRITSEKEEAGFKRFGGGDTTLFFYFEKIMKEQVFDFVFFHSEKAKAKLLDFIMTSDFLIEEENYIRNFIGYSNINFYKEFPEKKIISLDHYFSDQQVKELLDKVTKLELTKNPFGGEIETSIEDYKKFLLTILGPGKWEYTNLDIEKVNLSIEELVLLFLTLRYLNMPISPSDDPAYFSSSYKPSEKYILTLPYKYFWYKLKEAVSNN